MTRCPGGRWAVGEYTLLCVAAVLARPAGGWCFRVTDMI
jgi:hypothetical protein